MDVVCLIWQNLNWIMLLTRLSYSTVNIRPNDTNLLYRSFFKWLIYAMNIPYRFRFLTKRTILLGKQFQTYDCVTSRPSCRKALDNRRKHAPWSRISINLTCNIPKRIGSSCIINTWGLIVQWGNSSRSSVPHKQTTAFFQCVVGTLQKCSGLINGRRPEIG